MRVAIVGASGFLGGVICRYMREQGRRVSAVYRTEPVGAPEWWESMDGKIQGDICDAATREAVIKSNPDVCIYLVSLDHRECDAPAGHVVPINIMPAWHLLERFVETNWQGRFVYMSTQQVYGRSVNGEVTECDRVRPHNYYGFTHRVVEQLCEYFGEKDGLDAVSIRLSNSYGVPEFQSNDCWWTVVNELARMATTDRVLMLQSDGTPVRDFIYVDDVARFVDLLASGRSIDETVMNLGSGETYSIHQIARIVQEVYETRTGVACPIVQANGRPLTEPPTKPSGFHYDTSIARSYGFRPESDIKTGVNLLFDYLEST